MAAKRKQTWREKDEAWRKKAAEQLGKSSTTTTPFLKGERKKPKP